MSVFEVKIREIESVETHPNADALDLAVIGGYRAVVKRNEFKAGDLALYVPNDALFTDLTIAELLGVASYLTGKNKNRVKPVRLRGSLSEGIVVPFNKLDDATSALGFGFYEHRSGVELSKELKIEKYEEPIPITMVGKIRTWPAFLNKYDVENIKRPESFKAMVPGEEVVMTEKLHGTNITIAIGPGLEENEIAFVCSRNNAVKESSENVYWRAARQNEILDTIVKYIRRVMDVHNRLVDELHNGEKFTWIAFHGEVIGVQDLKYGMSNGAIEFRAFDISYDGKFANYDLFKTICDSLHIPTVPELYRGPYEYNTLVGLAEGPTLCPGGHIREGGVVKPVKERRDYDAGRCNFKFISEAYLLRKNGTELH